MQRSSRLLMSLVLMCSLGVIIVTPRHVAASHAFASAARLRSADLTFKSSPWSLDLTPQTGPTGLHVTIFAMGFPVDWPIYLYWNKTVVGVARAGWAGILNTQLTVPAASPGQYTVMAQPMGSLARAVGVFDVQPSSSIDPLTTQPNIAFWDSTTPVVMIPVVAPPPGAISALPAATGVCSTVLNIQQSEIYLLSLLNAARATNGIPALALSNELSVVARQHSCDLAEHRGQNWNGWPHTGSDGSSSFDRMAAGGFGLPPYEQAGENIGWGQGYSSADVAVAAATSLMLAEPIGPQNHRWNILNRAYRIVGIGIVEVDGWIWITEDFAG